MGCHHDIDGTDGAFYSWDGRPMHCAIDLDGFALNDLSSVETGLDRAQSRGQVLELYAHDPGRTVSFDKLADVLGAIAGRDLPFFTYADIANGTVQPTAGVLLSFDDAYVDDWVSASDLFTHYGARVTFFIAYYDRWPEADREKLRRLSLLGHDVEAHSIHHLRAPLYVEQKGLDAYLHDEALPSIQLLRDDGYPITTYAYPYGARTAELDDAMLEHVDLLRSVAFTWTGPADPCPQ
jgi:peptidoglycan/xylan/chitin deacetylase (PgdA/CDA1 family)